MPAIASLGYCEDLFQRRRRKTRQVMVGGVGIGAGNPIRVQSMTTTDTGDIEATVAQCIRMVEAGCEIVRITAPTVEDARALGAIKAGLVKRGIRVPLVADIHFKPEAALEAAEHVEKVRINPGNFADNKRFAIKEYSEAEYQAEIRRIESRFTPLVEKLKRLGRALRIGTNHGSLSDRIMNRYGDSPRGMVESALEFVRICEKNGYYDIVLSMKASNPKVMIAAYRLLSARMREEGMEYPFHLGVTEAGGGEDGRIKSAIGIGSLLEDGIGDTIRVSLTEDPEREVPVCRALLSRFEEEPAPMAAAPVDAKAAYCSDFYSYCRRETEVVPVGPSRIGGAEPVRVVAGASRAVEFFEGRLLKKLGLDLEIVSWDLKTRGDLDALKGARESFSGKTSRPAFLIRFDCPLPLAKEGFPLADLASWLPARGFSGFLEALKTSGLPQLIEAKDASEVLRRHALSHGARGGVLLGLRETPDAALLRQYRLLAAAAPGTPIHLRVPAMKDAERRVLDASVLVGSLLCDGIGDSVELGSPLDPLRNLELAYNILQGAGARVTKTEFVSCPSCGRTLFDLQSTTERIKGRTGHLKGLKIAIMGCIVNGPGEMADADFGYVGGAPGRINLYVGKVCVKKGIPSDSADKALVDLIKSHGKWVDPA